MPSGQWAKLLRFAPFGDDVYVENDLDPDGLDTIQEAWMRVELFVPQSLLSGIEGQGFFESRDFISSDNFSIAIKFDSTDFWWRVNSGFYGDIPVIADAWQTIEWHILVGAADDDVRINGIEYARPSNGPSGINYARIFAPMIGGVNPNHWVGVDNLGYSLVDWISDGGAVAGNWDFSGADPFNDAVANYPTPPFFANGMDEGYLLAETGDPGDVGEAPPGGPALGVRFYRPPNWRYVVTDLDSVTLTFLDRIASDREIEFDLNTPTAISGVVPSASPEVNILHDDGEPFLAEGTRLLYAFRREGGTPPWRIRAAGIVLDVKDTGDPNVSRTRFVAYDPWAYLYERLCRSATGALPGPQGLNFFATPVGEIALALLNNTVAAEGTCHIDAGTGFFADTEAIDYNVQRGKSVGEAWEDLCATELMDIELIAIYDPLNSPGDVCQLNIYAQPPVDDQPRGVERPQAIFSWDKPPRTLAGIERSLDGRQRADNIHFYTRFGNLAAGLKTDAAAEAKYGSYEYTQFFPDQIKRDRVAEWAEAQLSIRKRGVRTISPSPAQQQPPLIWEEFFVGDRVPVYASNRLRETIPQADDDNVYQRVYGITISLTDPDAFEIISEVAVSPDGVAAEGT